MGSDGGRGLRYHRIVKRCGNGKNSGKKPKPIIHWRNPIRGLFYYPKGLRRKRLTPREQKWKPREPLSDGAPFKPSSVVRSSTRKIFIPSEVIPRRNGEFINRSLF